MDASAVARVQVSFAGISSTPGARERFASEFFSALWADSPSLRALFPASMEHLRERFTPAIEWTLARLSDPDAMHEFLAQLARDHRKYGVEPAHYAAAGRALHRAVRRTSSDVLWSPRLDRDWHTVLAGIVGTMTRAAATDDLPAAWGATVVSHQRVLSDLAIIRLEADAPIPYHPGQYVSVQIPQRPHMWRYLSPAIPPNPHGHMEFHVRRVSTGWVSPAMVSEVTVGDRWTIGPPLGALEVDRAVGEDVLMIASGTGLAPLRAQIMDMAMKGSNPRVHLFYGGTYPCDLYDIETLWQLSITNPWLTVVPVTEETENPWWNPGPVPEAPQGLHRTLHGKLGRVVAEFGSWADRRIQIAGSPGMIKSTLYALRRVGTPRENIAFDPL